MQLRFNICRQVSLVYLLVSIWFWKTFEIFFAKVHWYIVVIHGLIHALSISPLHVSRAKEKILITVLSGPLSSVCSFSVSWYLEHLVCGHPLRLFRLMQNCSENPHILQYTSSFMTTQNLNLDNLNNAPALLSLRNVISFFFNFVLCFG